jgi:uncharacterized membrane protein
MYQIHPLIAHLPVGLFLGAGLLSVLGLFMKRGLFKELLVWVLALGIISTLPNIYTGLQDSKSILPSQEMVDTMLVHKRNGYIMLIFFFLVFIWVLTRRRVMVYSEYIMVVFFLVMGCSSVIYESLTGYQLVYHHGANVAKTCPANPASEETPIENASLFKY